MKHRNGKTLRAVDLTPLVTNEKTPLRILEKKRKKIEMKKVVDWLCSGLLIGAAIYFLAHFILWALRGFRIYGLD